MEPGADQPAPALRHSMKPLPYLAPTMKAPFFNPGTMTRHSAFESKSCGIPLSGVDMISVITSAAASNLAGASLAPYSSPALIAKKASCVTFIGVLLRWIIARACRALRYTTRSNTFSKEHPFGRVDFRGERPIRRIVHAAPFRDEEA